MEKLSDCSAEVPSEHDDDEEAKNIDDSQLAGGHAAAYKPNMYNESYHKASVLKSKNKVVMKKK